MEMQEGIPVELKVKLEAHFKDVHTNLVSAFRGNISQEEINGYLQAAEYEAEALLYSVKAEAARNIRFGSE